MTELDARERLAEEYGEAEVAKAEQVVGDALTKAGRDAKALKAREDALAA